MSSQKLSNRQWIYTKDYGLSQKTLSQALIRLSTSKVEIQYFAIGGGGWVSA
jgi:hypothetical protein